MSPTETQTQGAVRASIDVALRVARESLDASSDAVKEIVGALKTASDRQASADQRSDSVQNVVRSSLEVAQRVARESLDASADAAKEIRQAIDRALEDLQRDGAKRDAGKPASKIST